MSNTAATVFRTLAQTRRSARRFLPNKTIDRAVLKDILESTLRAPSSFNLQPTQIILVQDAAVKEKLADRAMLGAGNQFRTKDASIVAFFLSDLEVTKRINRIQQLEKGKRDPNYMNMLPIVSSFLAGEGHASTFIKQAATTVLSEVQPMPTLEPVQSWTYKSTALAAQTYVLAATSHDLATCIMEGFDGRRVKDILGIPDRYGVPLAVATGFDFHEPNEVPRTPRLGLEEVCFVDSFGQSMVLDEDNGGDDVHSDDDAGEVAAVAER